LPPNKNKDIFRTEKILIQKFGEPKGDGICEKNHALSKSCCVFFFGDGSFYTSKINFRRSFYWSFISPKFHQGQREKSKMNENLEDFDSLVYDVAGDLSHLGPDLFGDLFGEFHSAGSGESFFKILIPKDTATNRTLESSPEFFSQQKHPKLPIQLAEIMKGTTKKFENPPELRAPFLTFRKSFFCICTSLRRADG